jgi:hypothetical protein
MSEGQRVRVVVLEDGEVVRVSGILWDGPGEGECTGLFVREEALQPRCDLFARPATTNEGWPPGRRAVYINRALQRARDEDVPLVQAVGVPSIEDWQWGTSDAEFHEVWLRVHRTLGCTQSERVECYNRAQRLRDWLLEHPASGLDKVAARACLPLADVEVFCQRPFCYQAREHRDALWQRLLPVIQDPLSWTADERRGHIERMRAHMSERGMSEQRVVEATGMGSMDVWLASRAGPFHRMRHSVRRVLDMPTDELDEARRRVGVVRRWLHQNKGVSVRALAELAGVTADRMHKFVGGRVALQSRKTREAVWLSALMVMMLPAPELKHQVVAPLTRIHGLHINETSGALCFRLP